ncbi:MULTISPECIES: sugar ABC transporter permease [unclassified Mesorhizobium]|uniref:carbohydrate ABC transporter permease n=1 Tax=unclassified Mesorhizobium TaxID=325217 RepID=UPI000FD8CAF1|nr:MULTISPECIES: sugar ABC transporter permease [unclassified Mesorhizobium]TGQ39435.1 sugar ABC transporter permease [Mesorhizobium sp. M00.F.Ca.ET.216.01.1.1]TIS57513.1 MAG: ABC transporter permease subunit [Mesorhizobium sp.]TJW11705.1 MAG: ABC transporter permease subunit [Mesorhizobium sp.]TJW35571.1 MAG: ABC transporter permease subunit [Mesorhizobium sp.]
MKSALRSTPLLMILPSLGLAMFVIGYPIVDLAWTSLHEVSRFGQLRDFAGLYNFTDVFGEPLFYESLWRTIIWTVAVVGGTLLISLPVALVLNDDFIGRSLARVIIMLPWAISLTMTAVVWRWGLNGRAGLLNATLMDLHVIAEPIEWLATAPLAFTAEILIGILVSIPFTTTIFLGGLSSLPQDSYEASVVDGATGWDQFRYITLPLMKPFINIAIVLNVIYVFNSLPIIWVMTEGGPANGTDILVTYLYKLAFRFGQLGKASAISLIMFGVLLIFTALYVVMVMRAETDSTVDGEHKDDDVAA